MSILPRGVSCRKDSPAASSDRLMFRIRRPMKCRLTGSLFRKSSPYRTITTVCSSTDTTVSRQGFTVPCLWGLYVPYLPCKFVPWDRKWKENFSGDVNVLCILKGEEIRMTGGDFTPTIAPPPKKIFCGHGSTVGLLKIYEI